MKALLKEALLSLYYVSLCTTARNLNSTESKATLFCEAIKWFLLCKSDLKAHYKNCNFLQQSLSFINSVIHIGYHTEKGRAGIFHNKLGQNALGC